MEFKRIILRDLLLGFFLAMAATIVGMLIFLGFFTNYDLFTNYYSLKLLGLLGKIITIGAILNLFVFYFLLKKNKEVMARGVVLAMIILTLLTLFV